MDTKLSNNYMLISPENEINNFIKENEKTLEILTEIKPKLTQHFPNNKFSLELCDSLNWTSETKLLINVHVSEEMFFNGMLNHFNDIYSEIEPLIEDILCPIVLFPDFENKKYDKMNDNSAINLIARTAYFNNDYDGSIEREVLIRDIPYDQQKKEIIAYCETHDDIYALDIEEELQLDFNDICEILDKLKDEGILEERK